MLFNSQYFIFVFLPLVLIGWYAINHFKLYKTALLFLSAMSFWFYGYFNPSYLIILAGSILVNYSFSYLIGKFKARAKLIYIIGLSANILLLGYFKYYDFFMENLNAVFKTSFAMKHILLPLGISFFTLQQISYLTDRYWESADHYNFIEYLAYVTFFPQLIAGPIVLHNEIIPQYRDPELRKFNPENFKDGLILFTLGLAKKVLLADTFAYLVNYGFDRIYWIDTPAAWFTALGYTFELYFDFSGYCDMACGLGLMFNFKLPVNFKSPYKSHGIPEYWNRWHYTLTRFFTTYIYTPLTLKGVRKKKRKLYSIITPLVVYFISGFWHGASWTFVLWGLSQAVATIWCQRKFWKIPKKFHWVQWLGTFVYTCITQAIFRSETLDNMVRILKGMFIPKYTGFMRELGSAYNEDLLVKGLMSFVIPHVSFELLYWIYFGIMILFFIIGAVILKGKNAHEILADTKEKGLSVGFALVLSLILCWCIVSMSEVSTFLYFNF